MARKVRNSLLGSRSAPLKLKIQRKPYTGPALARGIMLAYRRNKGSGTWVAKASNGHGAYWTKAFADTAKRCSRKIGAPQLVVWR